MSVRIQSLSPFLVLALSLLPASVLLTGCEVEEADEEEIIEPLGQSGLALTREGAAPAGLRQSDIRNASTEVWEATERWEDTNTPAARAAGMAWGANSGLNWEQKYEAWIESMERTTVHSGYGETFIVTTPEGKSIPVPRLECAELLMTLRVAFASWYGLPFIMEASDGGTRIFAGHFGFRTAEGRWKNLPNFRTAYPDYSDRSGNADILTSWPSHSALRSRGLYGGGDENTFLGEGAKAGWYFDEMFLNKRVGYFMLYLLPYFGSINLADDANAWHVKPEGIVAGNILLKRWQRRGIGHVMLVKHTQRYSNGKITAELASGSMPRRQAVWETPASTKRLFTANTTGGEGETHDGHAYVDLGGGMKRFHAPTIVSGRWVNRVPPTDRDLFLHWDDKTERAARPEQFRDLLVEPSPEILRDDLLAAIEAKRAHLRSYPASCSARIAREDLFEELYALMEREWNLDKKAVDVEYRLLEDYVFAELVYDQSRTCCWNSTNRGMYDAIITFARNEQAGGSCVTPSAFMMRDGAYDLFQSFAAEVGMDGSWMPWSADESCPQEATVTTDTLEDPLATPWCEVAQARGELAGEDPYEANDTQETAYDLSVGGQLLTGAVMMWGDEDWFRLPSVAQDATVRVLVETTQADAAFAIELMDESGVVDTATVFNRTAAADTVAGAPGDMWVRVHGAVLPSGYEISFTASGGIEVPNDCGAIGSMQDAFEFGVGSAADLVLCQGENDWYRIGATTGSFDVTIAYSGGPVHMELLRTDGTSVETVNGSGGTATLSSEAGVRFLRVFGGSAATYSLTVE